MEQVKYAARMYRCPSCGKSIAYDDIIFQHPEPDSPFRCSECWTKAGELFHSLIEFMSWSDARAEVEIVFPLD